MKVLDPKIYLSKILSGAKPVSGEEHQYKTGDNSTHGENLIRLFYDRKGIEAATQMSVFEQLAEKREMPLKLGKEYTCARWMRSYERELKSEDFLKYGFLSSRDIADVSAGFDLRKLAEGATEGFKINVKKQNLSTKFQRYGEMIEYTDEVELFSNDDVQVRYREELGASAGQIFDDLVQFTMLTTNTVMYTGTATSKETMGTGITPDGTLDNNYRISYDFIRKCVAKLVRNRAEKNTEIVTGSTKIDTRTVSPAYYCFIGPEVANDLDYLTRLKGTAAETAAFIPAHQYASASTLAKGEIGQMGEVRFILAESMLVYRQQGADVPDKYVGTLSYTGKIGAAEAAKKAKFDVFPILFPTKGSFATVSLKGNGKVVFHSKAPSEIGRGNPFGTKGFFSSNFWYAGLILREERLLKAYCLASA